MKTHYTIHKMLSQGKFCKILKFIISHVIKYIEYDEKRFNTTMLYINIITLYEFHG
jgi:hypothetical protein